MMMMMMVDVVMMMMMMVVVVVMMMMCLTAEAFFQTKADVCGTDAEVVRRKYYVRNTRVCLAVCI
jgi:hypothetical protein